MLYVDVYGYLRRGVLLMIPWEATRREPMVDVSMVGSRQFGACFVVMRATGAILIATSQFLPLLVQTDFGYTATWAGVMLTPGGLVTMVMMFVVGLISSRDPAEVPDYDRARSSALAMYQLTRIQRPRLLVFRPDPHGPRRRLAADLHADHHCLL